LGRRTARVPYCNGVKRNEFDTIVVEWGGRGVQGVGPLITRYITLKMLPVTQQSLGLVTNVFASIVTALVSHLFPVGSTYFTFFN
jgi:hypothetical protein